MSLNYEVVYGSHEFYPPHIYAMFDSKEHADEFCSMLIKQAFDYDKLNIWVREKSVGAICT